MKTTEYVEYFIEESPQFHLRCMAQSLEEAIKLRDEVYPGAKILEHRMRFEWREVA